MAGISELLGLGGAEPKTTAEAIAAEESLGGISAGGLAGLAAASVFGGPIGLGIGLLSGFAANRHRRNIIDATAEDVRQIGDLGSGITEHLVSALPYAQKYGTEHDVEQLKDIAGRVDRFKKLASHYDPNVRMQALTGLLAEDAKMDVWRQDIETRTREVADMEFDLRKDIAKEYRQQITFERDALADAHLKGNKLLTMINDLGGEDPGVQGAFRAYLDSALSDYQVDNIAGSFSAFGLNLSAGTIDRKYSAEEMRKVIGSVLKTESDLRRDRINQIGQEASDTGFSINNHDGELSVEDLDTSVQSFRSIKPNEIPVLSSSPTTRRATRALPNVSSQAKRKASRTKVQGEPPFTIDPAEWVNANRSGRNSGRNSGRAKRRTN